MRCYDVTAPTTNLLDHDGPCPRSFCIQFFSIAPSNNDVPVLPACGVTDKRCVTRPASSCSSAPRHHAASVCRSWAQGIKCSLSFDTARMHVAMQACITCPQRLGMLEPCRDAGLRAPTVICLAHHSGTDGTGLLE